MQEFLIKNGVIVNDPNITANNILVLDSNKKLTDTGIPFQSIASDSNVVHLSGNESISGNKTFVNNVQINGDLIVNGNEFIVNTISISAKDNQIVINAGEVGPGVTAGYAGIRVDRGTLPNYDFQFRESDDSFVIGVSGQYQPVATREDTPINGGIAIWDSSNSKFITSTQYTSGSWVSKQYVSDVSASLQNYVNSLSISAGSGLSVSKTSNTSWNLSITGSFGDSNLRSEVIAISAGLNSRISNLESALPSVSANIISIVASISANLQNEIVSLSGQSSLYSSQISSISATNNSQTSNLNNLNSSINYLASITGGFSTNTQVASLTGQLATLSTVASLTGQLATLTTVASLTGQLQSASPNLSAFSNYNTNGFIVQTSTNTFVGRSLSPGTGISIFNNNGVGGNPSISVNDYIGGSDVAAISAGLYSLIQSTSGHGSSFSSSTSANIFAGIVNCSPGQQYYTVTHNTIDPNYCVPILTVGVPVTGSTLSIVGVYNRTPTSFQFELSIDPPTTGYSVYWSLITPTLASSGANGGITDAPADGLLYARKNNSWQSFSISGSSGNITQGITGSYVSTLNNISGAITIIGSGDVVVNQNSQTITISSGISSLVSNISGVLNSITFAASANSYIQAINNLSPIITTITGNIGNINSQINSISGQLNSLISITGSFATNSSVANSISGFTPLTTTSNLTGNLQTQINNRVPYTGATSNVDLGSHQLSTDVLQLNLNPNISGGIGSFKWNQSEQTIDVAIDKDVTLQLGQEELILVNNNTGNTITNGQLVYISGNISGNPSVDLARADVKSKSIVAGVATENIPSGTNGFITTRGKVRGLNTSSYISGQQLFLGETPGTFTNQISGFAYSSVINPIGFVGITSSISGDIYVTIKNESSILTLSERQTNIALGNTISTGIFSFSGMTVASSSSFYIPPLKGWIINNTGAYATQPVINIVNCSGGTYPVTNITTQLVTYVLIDQNNNITQVGSYPTPIQRRDNILLGKIVHTNKSSILTINNIVDYDSSPFSALRDMFAPIAIMNSGITISPNGSNLNFNKTTGTLYGLGINWVNDQKNPNSISLPASTPTTASYYSQLAPVSSNIINIDPTNYDLNGVITAIPAGGDGVGNRTTNQRVYLFPTGNVIIQYGQQYYSSLANALAAIPSESFVKFPAIQGSAVLIGIISVRRTATDLSNSTYAVFTPSSIFGENTGGTNGISTTTLQQAYDNSITPEIVTNASLSAFSLKRGSDSDSDNVLEIQNGLGINVATIDGYGAITSSYISGSNNSIVTHDVSGKLTDSGISIYSLLTNSSLTNSISGFTPLSTTATISSSLYSYTTLVSSNLFGTLVNISGNLQSQIDNLDFSYSHKTITQNSHGFSIGNVVRYNGSSWVLAQADTDLNSEALGIVNYVTANTFTLTHGGYVVLSGNTFVPGSIYFLSSSSPGLLTTSEPNVTGQVSKPMFFAISTNSGYVYNMRGLVLNFATVITSENTQTISGDKTFLGKTTFSGSIIENITTVSSSGTYNLNSSDYTVVCDTTNGNITVLLPLNPDNGRLIRIKKAVNANVLIIDPNTRSIDRVGGTVNITLKENRTYQYSTTPISTWYEL